MYLHTLFLSFLFTVRISLAELWRFHHCGGSFHLGHFIWVQSEKKKTLNGTASLHEPKTSAFLSVLLQRMTTADQSLGHSHEGEIKSILFFFSLLCIAVQPPPLLIELQLRHTCSPQLEQRMCLMESADGSVYPG